MYLGVASYRDMDQHSYDTLVSPGWDKHLQVKNHAKKKRYVQPTSRKQGFNTFVIIKKKASLLHKLEQT